MSNVDMTAFTMGGARSPRLNRFELEQPLITQMGGC